MFRYIYIHARIHNMHIQTLTYTKSVYGYECFTDNATGGLFHGYKLVHAYIQTHTYTYTVTVCEAEWTRYCQEMDGADSREEAREEYQRELFETQHVEGRLLDDWLAAEAAAKKLEDDDMLALLDAHHKDGADSREDAREDMRKA